MFVAKIFKDHGNTEIIGLTDQKTSKGTFFIYLTITHKREVRYISIGYEIDDLFQFDKGTVVCRKDAKVMNQRLDYVLSEYQEKLDSIDHQERFSCAQIKEMLENKKNADNTITIKDFMERRISDFRKEGRNSYADMNEYTLKKILSIY